MLVISVAKCLMYKDTCILTHGYIATYTPIFIHTYLPSYIPTCIRIHAYIYMHNITYIYVYTTHSTQNTRHNS